MNSSAISNEQPLNIEKHNLKKERCLSWNRKKYIQKEIPKFISDFGNYLLNRNFSLSTVKLTQRKVMYFCRNVKSTVLQIEDLKALQLQEILYFEEQLQNKINNNEITVHTCYKYLLSVKHFCDYLYRSKIINYHYTIPTWSKEKSQRNNDYIQKEDILFLLKSILKNESNIKYRNSAIFLLILETGCRPIEVSNIKVSDLNISERTISLYCQKSGKRTMLLNHEVVKFLKQYLHTRKTYNPSTDHLFLTVYGDAVSSASITSIIQYENQKAFGHNKINARALRHTFATNALQNNNDFAEVSQAMGHKVWYSTLYYLHKSNERLLNNTLQFNPFKIIRSL